MIDLLAMLSLPGAVPGAAPTEGVPAPAAATDDMTGADVVDFSAVLAQVVAQVLPSPLAPPPIAPLPTTAPFPVAPASPQTCVISGRSCASNDTGSAEIVRPTVVAVLPISLAFQQAAPEAQVPTEMVDWSTGHPVVPATPQALPVTDTDVPEREGAPATAVLPEPASKALEQPAALGVLGSDWGDGNVQRRVVTPRAETPHTASPSPTSSPTPFAPSEASGTGMPTYRNPIPEQASSVVVPAAAPPVVVPVAAPPVVATDGVPQDAVVEGMTMSAPVPTGDAISPEAAAPDAVAIPKVGDAVLPIEDTTPATTTQASPMATATAAQATAATQTSHPDATPLDRPARDRHVNGVAAPLRRAIEHAKEQRDGDYTMTVRLDPPELGTVRIRVVSHGDKVNVTLHTDLAEAKTELQHKQQDIAELLRHEGFSLDGFDVDTSDRRFERREEQPRPQTSRRTANDVFELVPDTDDGELRL